MNSHKPIDEEMSDDSSLNDERSEDEEEEKSMTIKKGSKKYYKKDTNDLLKFLVKISKDVTKPQKINLLSATRKYKEASGSTETVKNLYNRIRYLLDRIPTIDRLDIDSKRKIMFAFRIPIEKNFLAELREYATVKLDNSKCIIEYKKNKVVAGSSEKKDPSEIKKNDEDKKRKERQERRETKRQCDFPDDEDVEKKKDNKKKKEKLNEEIGETSEKVENNRLKAMIKMEREVEDTDKVERTDNKDEIHRVEKSREDDKTSILKSFVKHHPIPLKIEPDSTVIESANKRMKLEPIERELREEIVQILDEGEDFIEEIVPKEEPEEIVEKEEQNSQSKILEAFHTFVISLDIGELQDIQKKIEIKMRTTGNEEIPSKTILAAFSSCLLMINRNGSTKLRINGSFRLKEFLQLFRQFILSLKAPGLDGFLNEITQDIRDVSIAEKRIPINFMKMALETAFSILVC